MNDNTKATIEATILVLAILAGIAISKRDHENDFEYEIMSFRFDSRPLFWTLTALLFLEFWKSITQS